VGAIRGGAPVLVRLSEPWPDTYYKDADIKHEAEVKKLIKIRVHVNVIYTQLPERIILKVFFKFEFYIQ
jgi:hypothetical protein